MLRFHEVANAHSPLRENEAHTVMLDSSIRGCTYTESLCERRFVSSWEGTLDFFEVSDVRNSKHEKLQIRQFVKKGTSRCQPRGYEFDSRSNADVELSFTQ